MKMLHLTENSVVLLACGLRNAYGETRQEGKTGTKS